MWVTRTTRSKLDRQYAAFTRYQAACELIRIGDVMRVMQRAGRPVSSETVLQVEALARRFETAPRPRRIRRIETVHLLDYIPRQYANGSQIKFPEWVR